MSIVGFFQDPVDIISGAYIKKDIDIGFGNSLPVPLVFSRTYNSTQLQNKGVLGYGWTYNLYNTISEYTDVGLSLGTRRAHDVVANIVSLYAMNDIYQSNIHDIRKFLISSVIQIWGLEQIRNKAVAFSANDKRQVFVRLPNGEYSGDNSALGDTLKKSNGTYQYLTKHGMKYNFNNKGLLSNIIDIHGNRMTYTYNGFNLIKVEDAYKRFIQLSYADNKISRISDSSGRNTSFSYNAQENLISATDVQGKVMHYEYDDSHRMIKLKNKRGEVIVENIYDNSNRVTAQNVSRNDGDYAKYTYYYGGSRKEETGPLGHKIIYEFDDKGNLLSQQDALGNIVNNKYNGRSQLIESVNANGSATKFNYDKYGQLIKQINALNQTTDYQYQNYNLIEVKNALNNISQSEFNAKHQPLKTINEQGNHSQYKYNSKGLLIESINAKGVKTTTAYDNYGNVNTVKTANTVAINNNYNSRGNLLSVKDRVGNITRYQYDALGNVIKMIDPYNRSIDMTYDNNGQLTRRVDRNNEVINYTYTPLNKPKTINYGNNNQITFGYDARELLISMQDSIGISGYSYDKAQRLIKETDGYGNDVAYQYDKAGQVVQMTYPGNKQVSYQYDTLGRLTKIINWLGEEEVYRYNAINQVTQTIHFNGTITQYYYDKVGRILSIDGHANAEAIHSHRYQLDGLGNRVKETREQPLSAQRNLTNAIQFDYDSQQRRLLQIQESQETVTLNYNNEGQTVNKSINETNQTYAFEKEHRLIKKGNDNYRYDGVGNRKQSIVNGKTKRFIYNANGDLIAESNGDNVISRYYIYGALGLTQMIENNQGYSYHFNGVGSTVALTNSNQQIVNSYDYDIYGDVLDKQEQIKQPYQYIGQHGVYNDGNGLYYMRARYYDTQTRRFIKEDPIGLSGGINVYAYVGGNPVNAIDPSGLYIVYTAASIDVFRGIGGGADVALYKDNVTGEWGIAISGHAGVGYDAGFGLQVGATNQTKNFDGFFIEGEAGLMNSVNFRTNGNNHSVSNTIGSDKGVHFSVGFGGHICLKNCSDFYSLEPTIYNGKGF